MIKEQLENPKPGGPRYRNLSLIVPNKIEDQGVRESFLLWDARVSTPAFLLAPGHFLSTFGTSSL